MGQYEWVPCCSAPLHRGNASDRLGRSLFQPHQQTQLFRYFDFLKGFAHCLFGLFRLMFWLPFLFWNVPSASMTTLDSQSDIQSLGIWLRRLTIGWKSHVPRRPPFRNFFAPYRSLQFVSITLCPMSSDAGYAVASWPGGAMAYWRRLRTQ